MSDKIKTDGNEKPVIFRTKILSQDEVLLLPEDQGESSPNNPINMIHREKEVTQRQIISTYYEVFLRIRELVILLIFLIYSLFILYVLNYDSDKAKDFALFVLPVVTLVIGLEKNK